MSTAAGTGSTSPGGSSTYVQYNNAGAFGGDAGFTFDGTGTVYIATALNLGHASDTTITRSAAGDLAVEGNLMYRAGGTDVPVTDGGTGLSSTTAYAVLCGGTTSTGALQSVASVGTSGQVLTSNGAGALPTFQTVSSPSEAAQSDKETATSTTKYVSTGRKQYHPYAAKVYINFTWSAGVPTSGRNFNVTSMTDNGTGDVTFNFTVAFSDTNYAWAASGGDSGWSTSTSFSARTATANVAGSKRVQYGNTSFTAADLNLGCSFIAFGDQ